MPEEKQKSESYNYIVEREYLARISVAEFICRIVQNHNSPISEKEKGTG